MANDADQEPVTVEALRQAVAEGIKHAVSDPEVWAAAIAAIQARAKTEAGGWLLGGVKSGITKLLWLLVIGTGVYLVGGWTALVSFLKGGASSS